MQRARTVSSLHNIVGEEGPFFFNLSEGPDGKSLDYDLRGYPELLSWCRLTMIDFDMR